MPRLSMLAAATAALAAGADAARPGSVEAASGVAGLRAAQVEAAQRADFTAWASKHEKPYAAKATGLLGAGEEFEHRFGVFKANLAHVDYLAATGANAGGWTLSKEGPFMDRTHEEFAAQLRLQAPSENKLPSPFTHADKEAADKVDWRDQGAVTPIKNQGQCGSCWAFSTVGSVEGANFLATGKLVSLSEQELVSCDDNGDQGCNGGLMDNAFGWIIKNGGLDTEADYPYTGGAGQCDQTKAAKQAVSIDSYSDVTQNSEDDLRKALSQQPVSIAVDASLWQYYGGGIFDGLFGYCGTKLDHGVLLVAMDASDGKHGTYTIKNSWGPSWGEKGFIRVPQNKGSEGMCGMANAASYPVINKTA